MRIIELNEDVSSFSSYINHHEERKNPNYPSYEVSLDPEDEYKRQKSKIPAELRRGLDRYKEEHPRVKDVVVTKPKGSMQQVRDLDDGKENVEESLMFENEEQGDKPEVRKIDLNKPFRTLSEIANGVTYSDIINQPNVEIVNDNSEELPDTEKLPDVEDLPDEEMFAKNSDNIDDDDSFVMPSMLTGNDEMEYEDDDEYMQPRTDDSVITQNEWKMLGDAEEEEKNDVLNPEEEENDTL